MVLPALVQENVLKIQINTFAWTLKVRRKDNHMKLTDYYGTDKKDIYE